MSQIKPLGNRVLVKRKEATSQKGSIYLPESAKEKPKQGEIMAIGPGSTDKQGKNIPMEVKTGDQVLFSSYAGTKVKDSEDYLILSEDDILAVIQ